MRTDAQPKERVRSLRHAQLLDELAAALRARTAARVALVLARVSGLGDVNRRLGYVAGDAALDAFIARVAGVIRPQDQLFRLGGTSVALLLDNPLHEGHALLAAERVAQLALEPVGVEGGRARLRAHAGVSLAPDSAATPAELLRQCESALAEACQRDIPHVLFRAPAHSARTLAARSAWFDMDDALEAGQLEVFFQPQIELSTDELVAAEVLVRWHHPEIGHIAPGSFMPVEEDGHLMRALLGFVLNAALRHAAGWQSRRPGFGVSVNLAAANFDDPELVEIVAAALGVWSLDPSLLTLELTETSLMRNPAAGARVMGGLRDLGLRTSIDDFGTGYSSLAWLRDLPADELKVDRSFVAPIINSSRDHAIVRSIVQLAQAVDLRVVAEGIESEATARALREMGCDLGQGFHWAKPMTAADFEAGWIRGPALRTTA